MSGRSKASKKKEASIEIVEIPVDKRVPLQSWVALKIAEEKNLRPEQIKEIEVFIKKQGLSSLEDPIKYEKAYSKF